MTNSEKRRSPRVDLHFVVELVDGEHRVKGNISSGGVGFIVEGAPHIHPGDPMTVRLEIPDTGDDLVLSATVCHTGHRPLDAQYIGASFVDVDVLVQHPLERYVDEVVLLQQASNLRRREGGVAVL